VWGLLLAYNLVRVVMSRAAPQADVPPLRLSYRHALLALRAFWHTAWLTPPGALPRRIDALIDDLALFVLPNGACAGTRAPSSARSFAISANAPSRSRCRTK
jgi:hypothetical protein